jgi:hypothetical protein
MSAVENNFLYRLEFYKVFKKSKDVNEPFFKNMSDALGRYFFYAIRCDETYIMLYPWIRYD